MALWEALKGQILCATHRGDAGDEKLNSCCHRRWLGATEDTLNIRHAIGEPVIYGENDYNRATLDGEKAVLWNGSMGTILEVRDGAEYGIVADFDGEPHLLRGDDLIHLRHAYAITVHRAQGSQFPVIIIPIVRARNVDRTWIYTAMTRAEQSAILVGTHDVFTKAVGEKPHSDERRVGLNL
jgi:exodeoxyribonuclease V alpha subunit